MPFSQNYELMRILRNLLNEMMFAAKTRAMYMGGFIRFEIISDEINDTRVIEGIQFSDVSEAIDILTDVC